MNVSTGNIEKTSDDKHTDTIISDLGNPGEINSNDITDLTTVLSYLSDPKDHEDFQDHRYHYALDAILEAVTYEPENASPNEIPALRRAILTTILINSYPKLLENDPEAAARVVETMIQRVQDPIPGTMQLMIPMDIEEDSAYLTGETHAILNFFETVRHNIPYQSIEISKAAFNTLLRNLSTEDFETEGREMDILLQYLDTAAQQEDGYELFNSFVDSFLQMTKELKSSDEKEAKLLCIIPVIYDHLLSSNIKLGPEERFIINRRLLTKITTLLGDEKNPIVRDNNLLPLRTIITDKNNWGRDEKLFDQKTKTYLIILNILQNIVDEKSELPNVSNHDDALKPYREAYTLLGLFLEEYKNGVSNGNKEWTAISRNQTPLITKAMNTYMAGKYKGSGVIKADIEEKLEKIL